MGALQQFLGSNAAYAVATQQVNPPLAPVVGEGDAGKLSRLDAQRRRFLFASSTDRQRVAVVGVVAQTDAQAAVNVEQTVAALY